MMRALVALAILVALGGIKLPIERDLTALHRPRTFSGRRINLDLREKLGQLGFIAALSGFRAIVVTRFSSRHTSRGSAQNGPDLVVVPAHHNAAAPGAPVLGHGGLAHGLGTQAVAAMNDRTRRGFALRVKHSANISRSEKNSSNAE